MLCVNKEDTFEPYIATVRTKDLKEKDSFNVQNFNVPSFLIEHIEMLKEQIRDLKEKLNSQEK